MSWQIPAPHQDFFQLDRDPGEREGGLYSLIQAGFPIDGRVEGRNGPKLDFIDYKIQDADSILGLMAKFRLTWWVDGEIATVADQYVMIAGLLQYEAYRFPSSLIGLGASPESVVDHFGQLIMALVGCARERIETATPETLPRDLVATPGRD